MEIDFDLLHSFGENEKLAVYEVQVNDHVRFIAPYEGKFYILFWIEISKDGSICCGIRDLATKKYAKGNVQSENGINKLDWSTLPDLACAEDSSRLRKMTFHSSGKIHDVKYGEVTTRKPFANLDSQEELFIALFKEPSQYQEIVSSAKKKDICILSEIPFGHPIFLQAYIAPKEKYQHVIINKGHYQYTAVLECNGIVNLGDIVIQLCFSFSDEANYPPYSFMVWPAKTDDK